MSSLTTALATGVPAKSRRARHGPHADHLAAVAAHLDLGHAIHVGHSIGGGEVARYIARHGSQRVAKSVLIGVVPPIMIKTASNPGRLPVDVFDGIPNAVASNRAQFYKELSVPFFGYNQAGANVSQGTATTGGSRAYRARSSRTTKA